MKAVWTAVALVCLSGCSERAEEALPEKVRAVVVRSKTTQATYAAYTWNRIHMSKGPIEEWSAEFHSGHLHRVENPRDRVIADCAAGTGKAYSVETKTIVTGPEIAKSACGVSTTKRFVDAQSLGTSKTAFGPADHIQVTDLDNVRAYEITSDGAIVSAILKPNRMNASDLYVARAVEVDHVLPDPNMFDEASLARSYVPDRFKVAPKP